MRGERGVFIPVPWDSHCVLPLRRLSRYCPVLYHTDRMLSVLGIGLFHTWARLVLGFDGCWSSAASGISWHLNAAAGVNS